MQSPETTPNGDARVVRVNGDGLFTPRRLRRGLEGEHEESR
jgi:hypothetical protein